MPTIELEAPITDTHEIHLKLPDYVTASMAKIIVMYDNQIPNQETIDAIEAARAGHVERYPSLNALWSDLDGDD